MEYEDTGERRDRELSKFKPLPGASEFAIVVAGLALMVKPQYPHRIGVFIIIISGEISGSTALDDELAHRVGNRASDRRLMGQYLQGIKDERQHVIGLPIAGLPEKLFETLKVGKRRGAQLDPRHVN